jgi:elongation factor Ts
MANITPQMVKALRDKTLAAMGECKKALEESNGDMDAAIEYLRKKGAASAAKRAEREAKEGAVVARTSADGKTGILVEINSETDFVAKNEGFVNFTKIVADAFIKSDAKNIDELNQVKVDGTTIENHYKDILAKYSEKIEIRRGKKIPTNGYIESYVHLGGKLAVLVEVSCGKLDDKSKLLLKDIAMQIAAMSPEFVDKSNVSQERLEKEKEIELEKAIAEGKKPEIAEKIAEGKKNKFFEDFCLNQQIFVKDNKKVVGDVVAEIGKQCGCDFKVLSFKRWMLGGTEE